MIHFEIDENKNFRLFSKFQNKCPDSILCNCYKNKLELGCGYQNEIEDKIKQICEVAHSDEPVVPWWVDLLD